MTTYYYNFAATPDRVQAECGERPTAINAAGISFSFTDPLTDLEKQRIDTYLEGLGYTYDSMETT